jgi:hypothetical protein
MNTVRYNDPNINIKLYIQKKYIIIEPNEILNTKELKKCKNITFINIDTKDGKLLFNLLMKDNEYEVICNNIVKPELKENEIENDWI